MRREGIAGAALLVLLFAVTPFELLAAASTLTHELLEQLDGGPLEQRVNAARQLGHLGDDSTAKDLGKILRDKSEPLWLRRECAESLGRLAVQNSVRDLCKGAEEERGLVGASSIKAMGSIISESSLNALIDVLDHPIGRPLSRPLMCHGTGNSPTGDRTGQDAPEADDQGQPPADFRREFTPTERLSAAESLGRLRDPQAKVVLVASLRDADWRVVASCVGALSELGDASVIPDIEALNSYPSQSVRLAAQLAVARLSGVSSEPVLSALSIMASNATSSSPLLLLSLEGEGGNLANIGLFKRPSLFEVYEGETSPGAR